LSDAAIQYYGTGDGKTSAARIYLRPGRGEIVVNTKTFDEYFPNEMLKMIIRQPLVITETADKFDVLVRVRGGGPSGQAGALRHGIARALLEYNPELRGKLKDAGFLTRDPVRSSARSTAGPAPASASSSASADASKEDVLGFRHAERVARGRRALRPSDPALESQDEGVHLRGPQRHLHHRHQKTVKLSATRSSFVEQMSAEGGSVLFVGTKRPGQETIAEEAGVRGMSYVNQRWSGRT
jgi:small subunit ribosomal protein S9